MSAKRTIIVIISLLVIFISGFFTSCKSEKASCDANRHNNINKLKKNRSNYGTRYDYKAKPVRKYYVIRNGR